MITLAMSVRRINRLLTSLFLTILFHFVHGWVTSTGYFRVLNRNKNLRKCKGREVFQTSYFHDGIRVSEKTGKCEGVEDATIQERGYAYAKKEAMQLQYSGPVNMLAKKLTWPYSGGSKVDAFFSYPEAGNGKTRGEFRFDFYNSIHTLSLRFFPNGQEKMQVVERIDNIEKHVSEKEVPTELLGHGIVTISVIPQNKSVEILIDNKTFFVHQLEAIDMDKLLLLQITPTSTQNQPVLHGIRLYFV
ncbi:uncharacterized protein LOC132714933 [Ruditapes philippinarum]|uniref:uncharacterized protein LOC132714933 n=1 Tax=Ruditapes philippinarum TaxID=129788 RepID=UPI00295B46F8|nr:uncharacterized protein LOC132714933 [Ruditapes philippinarum]